MACGAGAGAKPAPLVDPSLLTYWASASIVCLPVTLLPSAVSEPGVFAAVCWGIVPTSVPWSREVAEP